jgi:aminoglycoside phosphotransferase (APT) family kinase protein
MHRESRILAALESTDVPVPKVFGLCPAGECADVDLYVMSFVEGSSLPGSAQVRAWLPTPELQQRCAASMIDVLAALHLVDPDRVGLGNLSRRDDFVGRQLKAWYRSWTAPDQMAVYDDARAHALHDVLQATKPEPRPDSVVHGDYGLHNSIVAADGTIAAVVDWEVCTLGDARADVAYVLNRWSVDGDVIQGREDITLPAGFGTRADVVRRYEERTGADLSGLDFFVAMNHWRSACIMHGVYARYVNGAKSSDGVDLESMRRSIGTRLGQAEQAAQRLGYGSREGK